MPQAVPKRALEAKSESRESVGELPRVAVIKILQKTTRIHENSQADGKYINECESHEYLLPPAPLKVYDRKGKRGDFVGRYEPQGFLLEGWETPKAASTSGGKKGPAERKDLSEVQA